VLNDTERCSKKFMGSQKHSFFHNLPNKDQVFLLRETENMPSTSRQLAWEIAEKLDLEREKVEAWLKLRRKKNIEARIPKILGIKTVLLSAEFARDP